MDYLQKKWKLWYKSLDVNHDGKISFEDVEESRNKFTDLHKILGDKADSVKSDMERWWKKYILRDSTELSEQDFVENLTAAYKKDQAAFVKEMQDCFSEIFDVLDINKDKLVELDELATVFKAFGHYHEASVTKFFQLYNSPEGVPVKDIVEGYVRFATSENSGDKDIVYEALQSFI